MGNRQTINSKSSSIWNLILKAAPSPQKTLTFLHFFPVFVTLGQSVFKEHLAGGRSLQVPEDSLIRLVRHLNYCTASSLLQKPACSGSAESQGQVLIQCFYQEASYFLWSIHRIMYNYIIGVSDTDYILVIMIYRYLCSRKA